MNNSQAYEKLYAAFVEHQQQQPYYIWGARAYIILGVGFFLFLSFILFKRTKSLNKEFTQALFYSLLLPTIFCFYAGFVFTPCYIAPFDLIWNMGFFRSTLGTHIEIFLTSAFCVPYITSLIYLGIIYMKAFFTSSRLHIRKEIQIFLGICSVSFILFGGLLAYFGSGYKQEEKRQLVIATDPRTSVIFEQYGAFVVNMQEAHPTIYILVGLLIFEGAFGIIFVSLLIIKSVSNDHFIFRILYTIFTRQITMSRTTQALQVMLFKVFVLHIVIFVSFYGLPISIMISSVFLELTFLTSLPLGEVLLMNFCQMPTVYCICYLYFVVPIKKAFVEMIHGKRGLRRVSQATSKEFCTETQKF